MELGDWGVVLSLVISAASFCVSFARNKNLQSAEAGKNLKDFHAEKRDCIRVLYSVELSLASAASSMHALRTMVRKWPDMDEKFELIESFPKIIENSENGVSGIRAIRARVLSLDPSTLNLKDALANLFESQTVAQEGERKAIEIAAESTRVLKMAHAIQAVLDRET